jgi:uracil-DNA glycosylase
VDDDETPGDKEDREGRPFVGPAGRELDRGLEAAGIARGEAYVTNSHDRGVLLDSDLAPIVVATIHPSAILRSPGDAARQAERRAFARDLAVVARAVAGA